MKKQNDLLQKLKSRTPSVRDKAAISIMDAKAPGGKRALLEAALNRRNIGYSGTLVYALEAFKCSDLFQLLFDMAIFGTYEVRCMALSILETQRFNASIIDLMSCEYKLASLERPSFKIEGKEDLLASLKHALVRAKRQTKTKK